MLCNEQLLLLTTIPKTCCNEKLLVLTTISKTCYEGFFASTPFLWSRVGVSGYAGWTDMCFSTYILRDISSYELQIHHHNIFIISCAAALFFTSANASFTCSDAFGEPNVGKANKWFREPHATFKTERVRVRFRVGPAVTGRPPHRSVREEFHSYGSSDNLCTSCMARLSLSKPETKSPQRITILP